VSALEVTTWDLEQRARPARPLRAAPPGATWVRLAHPATHFYRYLYETVGAPWLWVERRRMPDEQLESIVSDPDVHIGVAYVGGAPAGYFELDARHLRDGVRGEIELAYFGLVPECIGRGLGGWLLDAAIDRAWSMEGTTRLWVHTCSLDHPRALGQYERAGFVRVAERRDVIWDPRPLPIVPR